MSILETKIRKTHRQRGAPDFTLDVECSFEPGITAIFGPSGSGKSTWLECIAGLQSPEAGRIALRGRVLTDADSGVAVPPASRNLGYVFQNAALFPHMTVRQNVEFGLAHQRQRERLELTRTALSNFHISHLAEKRPAQISGGEAQRVALARALVRAPGCLLLDEPFSALDYDTKSRIMDDVLAWNRDQRIPVLFVTHALDEVFALAARAVVLAAGKIVADGPPEQVLAPQRERLLSNLLS